MSEAGFSGFSEEAVAYLGGLKANNNRAWFADNKANYERAIKRPAAEFCSAMTGRLLDLTGLEHGSKIYRMHRDLRFSKDKTPYNSHLHISFIPESAMAAPPHWFFGLEADSLAVGAGRFRFDKARLDIFRERGAGADGSELLALLRALANDGVRANQPELKRVPAPHGQDHANAGLLRRKSLSVWIDFDGPDAALGPDALDACLAAFARLKPVFDWLLDEQD